MVVIVVMLVMWTCHVDVVSFIHAFFKQNLKIEN